MTDGQVIGATILAGILLPSMALMVWDIATARRRDARRRVPDRLNQQELDRTLANHRHEETDR